MIYIRFLAIAFMFFILEPALAMEIELSDFNESNSDEMIKALNTLETNLEEIANEQKFDSSVAWLLTAVAILHVISHESETIYRNNCADKKMPFYNGQNLGCLGVSFNVISYLFCPCAPQIGEYELAYDSAGDVFNKSHWKKSLKWLQEMVGMENRTVRKSLKEEARNAMLTDIPLEGSLTNINEIIATFLEILSDKEKLKIIVKAVYQESLRKIKHTSLEDNSWFTLKSQFGNFKDKNMQQIISPWMKIIEAAQNKSITKM